MDSQVDPGSWFSRTSVRAPLYLSYYPTGSSPSPDRVNTVHTDISLICFWAIGLSLKASLSLVAGHCLSSLFTEYTAIALPDYFNANTCKSKAADRDDMELTGIFYTVGFETEVIMSSLCGGATSYPYYDSIEIDGIKNQAEPTASRRRLKVGQKQQSQIRMIWRKYY